MFPLILTVLNRDDSRGSRGCYNPCIVGSIPFGGLEMPKPEAVPLSTYKPEAHWL